jgi:hypothetical protein
MFPKGTIRHAVHRECPYPANPQPNDHRLISAIQATLREVVILCDDGRLLLNRVPPDFRVAGLP